MSIDQVMAEAAGKFDALLTSELQLLPSASRGTMRRKTHICWWVRCLLSTSVYPAFSGVPIIRMCVENTTGIQGPMTFKSGPSNPGFKPGQSGNPLGRPKGSRNKLSEDFIAAMSDDFATHGKGVIETVRTEKPDQYLKVIAAIIPKELHVKDATLDDMSDNELVELLAAVRSLALTNAGAAPGVRGRKKKGEEGAGTPRRPH